MKKAIIGLAIAIIILPFMAVNPTHDATHETKKATTTTTTTTTTIHETKTTTTTAQADTNNDTSNSNGNNTPVKHDNNNNKTCNHNYVKDGYTTDWGLYEGYICIKCGEGEYHLIDTETKTDTNKPTTTDNDATTTTTDTEKTNYSMSKVDYNNALYDYEIENGLYCEAREHYDENGNHTETNCNYIGGNE